MHYEIRNILVPTDFSETANNALRVAVAMAHRHNAVLQLLHIIPPKMYVDPAGMHGSFSGIEKTLLTDANINLQKHKTAIQKSSGLLVKTHTEIGTVAHCVSTYVLNHQQDIVVMGTHGISGWSEFFLGSNAMSTIKQCSCPVLTIPPTFTKTTFDSVLYPIRNVEGVLEKYDYIKPIIQRNDAKVHLLGVAYQHDAYEISTLTNKLRAVREVILHNNEYISYETHQCKNIAEKVLEVAHKRADDIMIINATLDKNWFKFFSGSYTQQIVNHSKIPVLSVKPALTPDSERQRQEYLSAEANHYAPLTILPN